MPPKRADPQAAKREFQVYRESQQWHKIEECHQQAKSLAYISETSKDSDLDGKFQPLWDLFYELSVVMKIRPPFKKIEHEWVRSMYFGQKRKIDNKEPPCVVDGVLCEYEPVDGDSQHNLRQALIKKIYNQIYDLDNNFDLDNYARARADIKKGFTQFFNLMKTHLKKSFKVIFQEKLLLVLTPFSDLLEINMKLVLHQLKYTTRDQKFINMFKYDAIVERYCHCLDKVIQILMNHHSKKVKYQINPRNIFKKINYENQSKVEQFYMAPYCKAFDTMKRGLAALFATGINFWKVPIEQNRKFVDDLCLLINWQLILERLFGNELKRDQMRFISQVLLTISKANELAEKYLIKLDPNSIEGTLPKLMAFRTIQHMRKYKDKVIEIRQREVEHLKMLGGDEQIVSNASGVNVNNHNQSMMNVTGASKHFALSKQKSGFEVEIEALGRYWIWDNYCDGQFKERVIERAVSMLEHINPAIHQDIEDSIIREGMLPRKERQNEELKSAAETLKHMKTLDNSLKSQNMRRPPQLWNFPKILQEEHKFRSIAEPKKCYVDGRIEKLDEIIQDIGEQFRKYNQKEWNQTMRRVIDFIANSPDANPFPFREEL